MKSLMDFGGDARPLGLRAMMHMLVVTNYLPIRMEMKILILILVVGKIPFHEGVVQ